MKRLILIFGLALLMPLNATAEIECNTDFLTETNLYNWEFVKTSETLSNCHYLKNPDINGKPQFIAVAKTRFMLIVRAAAIFNGRLCLFKLEADETGKSAWMPDPDTPQDTANTIKGELETLLKGI